MTNARTLALCADDFGGHAGVDGAIVDLVARGRVTTVSALVGGATWPVAGPRLAAFERERVEIGLHLDLTEAPLGGLRARRLPALIAAAYLQGLDGNALRTQIALQLDAFERVMQRAPDHVDGHQHVHQLPRVREALLAELVQRYPQRSPWLRNTRPPRAAPFKARVIDALGGAALRNAAARQGLPMSAGLLGVHGFRTDAQGYLALLARWLQAGQDGDVLMCHPGWSAGVAHDPLRRMRTTEWTVLAGDAFGALLRREGVRLAPLSITRYHGGDGSSLAMSPKLSTKLNHSDT